MPARALAAEEASWIQETIAVLAGDDPNYAKQLWRELRTSQQRSNKAVAIFFSILQLAARGDVIDTGERKKGRIVWGTAPARH